MTHRTIYFFRKYEDAGPFVTVADAEETRDELIAERYPDEPDDWERKFLEEMFEIVPVEVELWVTDADESFDGFGTTTLEILPQTRRGRNLRLVGISPEHSRWQTMRYGSGGNVLYVPLERIDEIAAFLD